MSTHPVLDVDLDAFERAMTNAPPRTPDDQTVLVDGRRLDSPESVVDWLVEIGSMTRAEAQEFLAHR